MEVTYTEVFKKHIRKLSRRYRSLQSDLEPLIDDLKSGLYQVIESQGLTMLFTKFG